jgi:hypothetical protein
MEDEAREYELTFSQTLDFIYSSYAYDCSVSKLLVTPTLSEGCTHAPSGPVLRKSAAKRTIS